MKNSIKNISAIASFAIIFAIICIINLLVLVTWSTNVAKEKPPAHTLKYVANNVWHCDTGGSVGCDTVSSHVWQ